MPKTLYACTFDDSDLNRPFEDYQQIVGESLADAAVRMTETTPVPTIGAVVFVRSQIGQWYKVTIKDTDRTRSRVHFGIETVGRVQDMAKMGVLLGCAAHLCQECGGNHRPEEPHNKDSLRYQYAFYQKHDRWPTWWDAMEHCTPELREQWVEELKKHGVDQAQLEVSVG
jgi:hypothetical protein